MNGIDFKMGHQDQMSFDADRPFAAVGMLNRFNAFCSGSSDSTTSMCLGIMVPLWDWYGAWNSCRKGFRTLDALYAQYSAA